MEPSHDACFLPKSAHCQENCGTAALCCMWFRSPLQWVDKMKEAKVLHWCYQASQSGAKNTSQCTSNQMHCQSRLLPSITVGTCVSTKSCPSCIVAYTLRVRAHRRCGVLAVAWDRARHSNYTCCATLVQYLFWSLILQTRLGYPRLDMHSRIFRKFSQLHLQFGKFPVSEVSM